MRKLDARQMAREKSSFRYSSALERGDFATVEIILQDAERDPLLAQMIAEINMVYESELIRLSPSNSRLNHSTNHHRKDLLMTTITLPAPQKGAHRWLPYTLAAACLSVLFIGALLMRPNPNGSWLAGIQVQSTETATPLPSLVPTSTPTPVSAGSADGTALPPTVVPPAGDFTPTPVQVGNIVLPPVVLQPTTLPACEGTISSDTGAVLLYSAPTEQTDTSIGTISNQTLVNIYEQQVSANGANNWYFVSASDGTTQSGWVKGANVLVTTPNCFTDSIEAADVAISFEQAYDLYLQEKYTEAAAAYEQLLTSHAHTPILLYGYGRVLIELERPKDAIRYAQQIRAANPQGMESYVLESMAYLKLSDNASALASATAGIEINPTSADLLAALALTYTHLQRSDEALKYGAAAVQSNESSSDAHHAYAIALASVGNREEAITEFEQAIQFSPQRFSLYADLALQYKALNRMDDALATYEQILALQPENTKALVAICETYAQVGNNDSAESYCKRAITIDPTYAEAYKVLGGVHFRQHNYEAAIQDFDQCLALGSLAIECYYQRGLASFYIGDCDTAWSALIGASAFNPDQAIYEIINSGLKLITENCPKYKDLVIAIPTPDADLTTPVPMTGGNDMMTLATPTPAPAFGIVEPTVVPPANTIHSVFSDAETCKITMDTNIQVFTRPEGVVMEHVQPNTVVVVIDSQALTDTGEAWDYIMTAAYGTTLQGWVNGKSLQPIECPNVPEPVIGVPTALPPTLVPPADVGVIPIVPDTNSQLATVIPTNVLPPAPVLAGTPTAYFDGVMRGSPPVIVVLEDFAAIPANTEVQIVSAAYDDMGWTYEIQNAAGITIAISQDDLIRITALGPTTAAVPEEMCQAVNMGRESVPVYSEPSSDENIAIRVNYLAPDVPAKVLYQQFNRTTGENWYLVLAVLQEGKHISGWVSIDSVMLVGMGCPTVPR